MSFIFNKELIVIGDLESDENVLLKNISSNRIFEISPAEYEIIIEFTKTNSIKETFDIFSKEYDVDESVIEQVIAKAKEFEFIEEDIKEETNTRGNGAKMNKILYAYLHVYTFLRLDKLKLFLDLNGSSYLIKLVRWKFKNFSAKFYRFYFISQYVLLAITFTVLLFFISDINFNQILFNLGLISPFLLIVLFLPISLFFSFLHEFSHFCVYKLFGGKQNEMGFALMYKIMPVFFISTEDMVLWKEKKKKIYVSIAGLVNDFILLFILLLIQPHISIDVISALMSFLIFSILFKFIYNANPFAPGSDMYFIISDTFNLKSPFLAAHNMYKSFFTKDKPIDFSWFNLIFGLFSYISIISYSGIFIGIIVYAIKG